MRRDSDSTNIPQSAVQEVISWFQEVHPLIAGAEARVEADNYVLALSSHAATPSVPPRIPGRFILLIGIFMPNFAKQKRQAQRSTGKERTR
jgi:hypothetical protein